MANKKISALTALTGLAATDEFPVVDKSDTTDAASGTTKRMTWLTFVTELFASKFAADAGSNDTYVATLSPVPAAYVTGEHYRFKANTANTGAATINFNGLGAKTIKKAEGGITTDLADNDIRAGQWVDLVYDGTNMQMQSNLGNAAASSLTQEQVEDIVGAMAVAGSGISVSYNDGAGTLTIANTDSGTSANSLLPAMTSPPTLTNWTWVNQGVASAADCTVGNRAGIFMDSGTPAAPGANYRILKRTAPATPYVLTAGVFLGYGKWNYGGCGVGWRASGSGKFIILEATMGGGNSGDIRLEKWDSPTAASGGYQTRNHNTGVNAPFWIRLSDDGTNRQAYWSPDGSNWILFHSVGRTDYITADELIIGVGNETTATNQNAYLTLFSWVIT